MSPCYESRTIVVTSPGFLRTQRRRSEPMLVSRTKLALPPGLGPESADEFWVGDNILKFWLPQINIYYTKHARITYIYIYPEIPKTIKKTVFDPKTVSRFVATYFRHSRSFTPIFPPSLFCHFSRCSISSQCASP